MDACFYRHNSAEFKSNLQIGEFYFLRILFLRFFYDRIVALTLHLSIYISGRYMGHISVIGSCNMDLMIEADRRPQAGETVMGKRLIVSPGGKGPIRQ